MKTSRERLTVGRKGESDLIRRHKSVYELCSRYASGKRVLDLGCGDGYGSFMLAHKAKDVLGLDIDKSTINTAKRKYKLRNLLFNVGDINNLSSFKPFDVVVSLQVIEHIEDDRDYLSGIRKVLKRNGVVILTTPNRKLRLNDGQKPWNPFHVREYDKKGLNKLLLEYFSNVRVLGLTTTGETYDIEIKRLLIRRFIARFDLFGLYNLIPEKWATSAFGFFKKIISRSFKNPSKKLSPKGFFITKDNIDKAFDLIAICKKN